MHCSHDSNLLELHCDEDTLVCTLVSVRWLYFDEDTLICTLLSVRCLYFVGAVTQRSRGLLCASILVEAVVGMIRLCWLGLTSVSLILTAVSFSLTAVKSCWLRGWSRDICTFTCSRELDQFGPPWKS